MKKLFLLILVGLVAGLGSCSAKQPENNAQQPQAPAGVVVKTLPKTVPGKDVLKTILAQHKGKVVVVDFWATWCGPCMWAMKQIDPIKDSYIKSKQPIAFVYITGETSPQKDWNAAIKNIKGYHYRLTDAQFNDLLGQMGISGIPTYYIADKKGARSYDNVSSGGYPGDDVIKSEIEKALSKK